MIEAIFFSRFHPDKGPIVVHQVPEGAIVPSTSSTVQSPLFDFASVSDYLIPRQEFCDRLVMVCANRYRIVGHPVCISDPERYERNEFIFNFAFVLGQDVDTCSYKSVVRKLARLFRNLEEQTALLSGKVGRDDVAQVHSAEDVGEGTVYALCEMIMEDLNNYCECMIPIDRSNTLNIKLFPTYPTPAPVRSWHVPLSTVRLSSLIVQNSDLTMSSIIPYIDGVNSVATIAQLADTDLKLTRKAISHLLYYGCLLLLDIFQFSGIYAPTPEISNLFLDQAMQEECARYVATTSSNVEKHRILELYASLRNGINLKAWCIEQEKLLQGIDVRRLITFGVIKGFLYRVHKYAVVASSGKTRSAVSRDRNSSKIVTDSLQSDIVGRELPLARYLDGLHCFDEICSELRLSEQTLLKKLKERRDIQILYR